MAKTVSSLNGAQSPTKNLTVVKTVKAAFAALLSAGLAGVFALPAYSAQPIQDVKYASQAPQTLKTIGIPESDFSVAALAVGEDVELLESERLAEEAELAELERVELELQQELQRQEEQAEEQRKASVDVPAGAGASGLLSAAYSQLGVGQDCTALVENSLRTLGHSVGDLGTGIWEYDTYGSRVSLDALAPGDILVYGNAGSGAHVAIYAGDGQAVHGGMWAQGGTITAGVHFPWEPLTGAIRPY